MKKINKEIFGSSKKIVTVLFAVCVLILFCFLAKKIDLSFELQNVADSGNNEVFSDTIRESEAMEKDDESTPRLKIRFDKIVQLNSDGTSITKEYTYNERGDETKEIWTYSTGKTVTREYYYDDNGNKTKYIEKNSIGDVENVYEYSYGDGYDMTVHTERDGDVNIHKQSYDSKGNIIKSESSYSDGTKLITERIYDDKNNLIKESIERRGISIVYEYIYHSKNKMTETITFSDEIGQTTEWILDNKGRKIRGIATATDGESFVVEYSYDEDGNQTKHIKTNVDGEIISTWETSYDKNGNITRDFYVQQEEIILDIEYKYYGRRVFYEQ